MAEDKAEDRTDILVGASIKMRTYGGSFARAIAEAYLYADHANGERLVAAFPELFEKYHPKNWP